MRSRHWDEIAEKYFDEIVSPLQKGVKNPLFKFIENLDKKKFRVAADLGTGIGTLLPFLSENFEKVLAIDFSEKMIEKAKQVEKKNVEFHIQDLRNLEGFKEKFDVAVSVNSIIYPSVRAADKILSEIWKSIKPGGLFVGILPSMESIIYQGVLIYDREIRRNTAKKALTKTKRKMERSKYDFIRGIYDDEEKQKYFYDFEILVRLQKAGFKNIKISKVLYPWGKHIGDYEDFHGKPEMWDWFVVGER